MNELKEAQLPLRIGIQTLKIQTDKVNFQIYSFYYETRLKSRNYNGKVLVVHNL